MLFRAIPFFALIFTLTANHSMVFSLKTNKENKTEEMKRSGWETPDDDASGDSYYDLKQQKLQNQSSNSTREAIRQKKMKELKRISQNIVRNTIDASRSESCDIRFSFDQLPNAMNIVSSTMKNIKGEVCGSYYKVLNLDRNSINEISDENSRKKTVKKAFRKISLIVHPDKHGGSSEAQTAFEIVQDAYDCISDESCRHNYHNKLLSIEEDIRTNRIQTKDIIVSHMKSSLKTVHYYTSISAYLIHRVGIEVIGFFDQWRVRLFDERVTLPVGKVLLCVLVAIKAKSLFLVYGLAYSVVFLNYKLLNVGDLE